MNRRFLLIFLLFSLGIVFIFPQNILAEIQLSKEEGHYLLNSVRQGLIDEWINITSSSDFSQPERQAALFLIRNAIQQKELNYALKELPMDGLESLVKTAISLYFNPPSDAGEILDKIEKSTVEKALEIATEWFLQNEVKVSSGKLTDSFTSYKGNFQESVFYYNLVYRRLNNDYGELVVEFYSPEEVEPKKPEASTIWLKGGYWEFESWQSKGNEKIKPFIIKIKGKVRETSAEGYDWEETLGVEITFPESMPEMPDLPEESTIAQIPIIGDYYLDWRNRIEKTMVLMEKLGIVADIRDRDLSIQDFLKNIKDSTKNTVSKVWSYVA